MAKAKIIYVYEYETLSVGSIRNGHEFCQKHFDLLAAYLTQNPKCGFYSLLHKRVKFCNYVGVIKVAELTIEVLPKTDKHEESEDVWQSLLLNMLAISLQVEAKTTTNANIQIKRHSVLETYIEIFLDEVAQLIHHGLVKKYRQQLGNQNALKGKLLIQQHVSKNIAHAERFFVSHTVYDRDNVYNYIVAETLYCIKSLNVSDHLKQRTSSLLLDMPECRPVKVTEKLFQRLTFDRKTESYKTAIALARIILLNYHPDVKGGQKNVLAIMFDMNHLWENYVYWSLKKILQNEYEVTVKAQQKTLFWQHPEEWSLRLKPDLVVDIKKNGVTKSFILDTKWKYRSDTSIEDVRQMFAYSHYFSRDSSYLIYPHKMDHSVRLHQGHFYSPGLNKFSTKTCGTGFINVIVDHKLNRDIGNSLLKELYNSIESVSPTMQ
jgi:5-methylcytosine-specific restriction enzyme subunit McrC